MRARLWTRSANARKRSTSIRRCSNARMSSTRISRRVNTLARRLSPARVERGARVERRARVDQRCRLAANFTSFQAATYNLRFIMSSDHELVLILDFGGQYTQLIAR